MVRVFTPLEDEQVSSCNAKMKPELCMQRVKLADDDESEEHIVL